MPADTRLLTTMMISDVEAFEQRVGTETLVICGAPRGMTSMVAYALYEIGYFLGPKLHIHNYEDVDFLDWLADQWVRGLFVDRLRLPRWLVPARNRKRLREVAAQRNAAHTRWGFKLPHALYHLDALVPELRNPIVVVCVRNPTAVARSVLKRERKVTDMAKAFEVATRANNEVPDLLRSAPAPVLMIDMDIARLRPRLFMRELASVLKIPEDDARLDAIGADLIEGGYRKSEPRNGVEFVKSRD